MNPRDVRVHLFDAAQACERILAFTAGKTLRDFETDDLLRSGVERQFIILGEALVRARSVDDTIADRIDDFRSALRISSTRRPPTAEATGCHSKGSS